MSARSLTIILLVLAMIITPISAASARPAPAPLAPGDLDPSFSQDGKLVVPEDAMFKDMKVQPDGKILIAAARRNTSNNLDIFLLRYNVNGSLDTSFSDDGRIISTFGSNADDIPGEIVLQADGKIIVTASSTVGGQTGFGLIRFLPDGSLDSSFAGGGKIFTPLAVPDVDSNALRVSVALQVSSGALAGNILVGGSFFSNPPAGETDNIILAAFLPSGQPNLGWGDQGVSIFPKIGSTSGEAILYDLAEVAGGFFVVGSDSTEDYGWWEMHVFNADGSHNRTPFNPFQHQNCNAAATCFDWAGGVEVQPDGKVVVAGMNTTLTGMDEDLEIEELFLIRFNPDWSVDTSFGHQGGIGFRLEPQDPIWETASWGFDLALQPDGKIVAVGASQYDFAVMRLNPDGTPDYSFGAGGQVVTPITSGDFVASTAHKVALSADGKIVTAGVIESRGVDPIRYRVAIARYLNPTPQTGTATTLYFPMVTRP